jgi:Trypsin-like peptidase domain
MTVYPWHKAVEDIRPHVFRITTPRGSGTGFLVARQPGTGIIGIATAAHVIDHAHYWEQPIRIEHSASGASRLIRPADRAILLEEAKDTAAIVIEVGDLALPTETLPLGPEDMHLKVGNEIGWLGFPAVAASTLCFFSGRVSAWTAESYLVDGVAINGVSGGPAFHLHDGGPILMGVMSAYIPNRATGETLPGLAVVRDVDQFHSLIKSLKSVDEAKEEEAPAAEPPPTPPDTPAGIPARRAT